MAIKCTQVQAFTVHPAKNKYIVVKEVFSYQMKGFQIFLAIYLQASFSFTGLH